MGRTLINWKLAIQLKSSDVAFLSDLDKRLKWRATKMQPVCQSWDTVPYKPTYIHVYNELNWCGFNRRLCLICEKVVSPGSDATTYF